MSRAPFRLFILPSQLFSIHFLIASIVESEYLLTLLAIFLMMFFGFLGFVLSVRLEKAEDAIRPKFRLSILTLMIVVGIVATDASWFSTNRPWQHARSWKIPGGIIHGLQFSPDGNSIVSFTHKGELTIWDVSSGKKKASFMPKALVSHSLSFSPNGQKLAFVSNVEAKQPCSILVYQLDGEGVEEFACEKGLHISFAQFEDKDEIVYLLSDGTIRRWNTRTQSDKKCASIPRGDSMGFSPNGEYFFSARKNTIRVGHVHLGDVKAEFRNATSPFFGRSNRFLYFHRDRYWHRIDLESNSISKPLIHDHLRTIHVAVSHDSQRIASGRTIVDLNTRRKVAELPGYMMAKEFSPDGKTLVTMNFGRQAELNIFKRKFNDSVYTGLFNSRLWIVGLLSALLGWSLYRDTKALHKSSRSAPSA